MKKTKESQLKAADVYRKRNPERIKFLSLKNNAFNFVSPQPGSTSEKAIKWAKAEGIYDDALDELLEKLSKKN